MDAWLSETFRLLVCFFTRENPAQTYAVIAVCSLLGGLALSRVSTELGAIGAFYTTGVLLTASGLILLIAAMALPSVFDLHNWWMPPSAGALVLLAVVLPLTRLFQKGTYVTALIGWTVTLLTIGAVLTLEPRIKSSVDRYVQRGIELNRYRIETERHGK